MRLWVKSNGAVQLLIAGATVSLLSIFLKDIEITLPNMAGGPLFAQVPLNIVLSQAPVIYFSRFRDGNLVLSSIVSDRGIFKIEALIPLVVILSSASFLLAMGLIAVPASWTVIQNLTLLFGIQMTASTIVPPKYASLAPATWVLAAALFGNDFQNGSIRWWAFVIERESSLEGWGLSVIILAIGMISSLSVSRVWRYRLFLWNK